MKKIYFLFLFCCLSFATFAQTVTIYSTGAAGSFTTGTATSAPTDADGNIVASGAISRGYGVFDLSSIPAGATITSCIIGFNVASYTGFGAASGWNTYGYAGDLSTFSGAPATLFANMVAGTSLSTATYGGSPGNKTLASTAAAIAFVQANRGSKVSISWTGGNTRLYTITGETGTATTAGTHAPYLQITYTCTGVSGVSASAAPNPLCVGAALTLTGVATGATTYSWSGPGAYASTQQSPTFATNAASAGIYTFTAYNAGGCGTPATTAAVTLNATPTSTITPTGTVLLCTGGSQVFNSTTGAGYTYQWYESGTALTGSTNQTYTANLTGSYSVFITDPTTGCGLMSPATVVSVIPNHPPLTPAGSAGVCIGNYITLGVNLTGIVTTGITYQWTNGGSAIGGATSSTYTTNVGGSYNCILTVPGACFDTTLSTSVTIFPKPTPTAIYSADLLSTSSSYTSYQWFLNLVAIPGATSSTLVPPANGSYRVSVTDVNGCSNSSNQVNVYNLGVKEISNSAIKIYPNPAGKTVHIESAIPVRAVIMSIEGKKLLEQANATDIDVNTLPVGLYMIMLYNEAGERVTIDKLIKE